MGRVRRYSEVLNVFVLEGLGLLKFVLRFDRCWKVSGFSRYGMVLKVFVLDFQCRVLGVLEGFAAFDSFPEVFRRAATVVWHIRVTSVSIPSSGGLFQQVDNLEPPQCWG